MRKSLYLLIAAAMFVACSPKIYKTNDFESVASRHKIVAILPSDVTISLRPNQAKKVTEEDIRKNEESTGLSVQDRMYSWFLRRSEKYNYTVKFQDVSKTNAILKQNNISYLDLRTKSKDELSKLLGVDAVISSSVRMEKPMSEGAAIAVGLLIGAWGATNTVNTTINIHEGQKGDLMWKYDYEASGSVGSSTDKLVSALMRNASKKFPYNSK